MKIEKFTLQVLKNFASINPSIYIRKGNILETISISKTIKAKAEVGTDFPRNFALYNLLKLISVLNIYDDPDVDFEETMLVISSAGRSTKLMYSDETLFNTAPSKDYQLPSIDVSTELTHESLSNLTKVSGVLGLQEIILSGDGENLFLSAADSKNPRSDVHSILLGGSDKKFRAVFKLENLLLLPDDYTLEISREGIARVVSKKVEYFVAMEIERSFFKG